MTDIVISIAAKVAEILVPPTIRLGQFLFCANKITKKLKEELVSEENRIQTRIEEAKNKCEIIKGDVMTWMNDVTKVLQEVECLERETEANRCCYQAWSPTWRRYRLCKHMRNLKRSSQFVPFSQPAPLPGIKYESSKDFTYFESTKQAYNQLFEALRDDTSVIGLYGMGGCGKTTLVTEVGKQAEELNLFDKVLLVTVSQTPNILSIQEKMAEELGLKLEDKGERLKDEGLRAQRLWLRLKDEERVLIIVDDVWNEFNLKDIGIKFNESNRGRHKVLLTTRRQHVCNLMDCGWKIQLELLFPEEAWNLFRNFAAMDCQSYSNEIEHVAQQVAGECKGLPIAIKVVASSLKGKLDDFQLPEWKVALQNLKHPKLIGVEEGERTAFSCFKLSYDYLVDAVVKLLFFMCAMFPEDYQIPVEDLIRYGVGLRVRGEFDSVDSARNKIRASLNELLDCCLLEHTSGIKASFEDHFEISYVKMHDLVRGLALWMAYKEDHTTKVNHEKDVKSLVEVTGAKDCFTISSQCRKFQETDHLLDAPKLEVLILNTVEPLHLSYASIEAMKGLKVLAIINQSYSVISLLPQSIGGLSNLRTLRLCGWDLGDMSFIASLRRLEVLVLQWCHFKEVPDEIGKLSELKLLELTDCQIEENYNLKTGRWSKLEELYVFGASWQCCAHFATLQNLQRYKLKKEQQFDFEYIATEPFAKRKLCLERHDYLPRPDYLPMLEGCKNIVPDMEQVAGRLGDLTELRLHSCYEIECLVDTTSQLGGSFQENATFDRLIELELEGMENLKELCYGAPPAGFFRSLEELHISECQQLLSIFPLQCDLCNLKILNIDGPNCAAVGLFSMSVAQSLQKLEELIVYDCQELRYIIANVGADETCNRGEEISPASCDFRPMFPSLKKLSADDCPNLLGICPDKYHKTEVDHPKFQPPESSVIFFSPTFSFQYLQSLEIKGLTTLKFIFSMVVLRSLSELKFLTISDCDELIKIIADDEEHADLIQGEVCLPKLEKLEIRDCNKLKLIFSMVVLKSLSELKFLTISNCDELIEIIADDKKHADLIQGEVCLPKLEELEIRYCNKLKFIFSMVILRSLSELKFLIISDCDELIEVIDADEEHADLIQGEVCLPKLEKLYIDCCNKLKSLFCLDTVLEEESLLPNLSSIELSELPNFVNICRGFMIHKLKLLEFDMRRCPNFVPILGATQVIPFHHKTEEKVTVWDITVNQLDRQEMLPPALQAFLNLENLALRDESGVEGILHLQVGNKNAGQSSLNSNLRSLELVILPDLRFIWGSNITVLKLHRLDRVCVSLCPKLKTIFPSGIVGSLQSLEKLDIRECEELEEIIIASSHVQQKCFPKLWYVNIGKCDKIKWIFSDYMPRHFPQLSEVYIEDCNGIERIFGGTRVADEDDSVVVIRDSLWLRRLPNFAEIGHGIQLRMKPRRYEVDDCPKYTCQFI